MIAAEYGAASDGFAAAFARAGTTRYYRLAGKPVRIRVAGPSLAEEIDLPLRHLRLESALPPTDIALSIDMWNAEETGVAAVPADGEDLESPFGLFFASDDRRYLGIRRESGSLWQDCAENRIVGCSIDLASRAIDERARPFHRLLAVWLGNQGIQFVHAGLVARRDPQGTLKGILFVGRGGSGKTTSSIACFRGGLIYLGDDFIGLERAGDGFLGHSLFGSCLVNVDHIRRFPDLSARSLAPRLDHEQKAVIYMAPIDGALLADKVTIAAVVMPKVVDRPDTVYRPATKGQALLTLAPSSVMSLPIMMDDPMDRLADLVGAVPSFWLELGRDVDQIAGTVNRLFDELDARRAP
ncbi:MAG: hypothetical protein AB7O49_09195 [Sphingomonadales bacterium]